MTWSYMCMVYRYSCFFFLRRRVVLFNLKECSFTIDVSKASPQLSNMSFVKEGDFPPEAVSKALNLSSFNTAVLHFL